NADLNCSQDSTTGVSGKTTNSVNGTIDEVMIFNTSLSANEIQGLYAQGSYRQDAYLHRTQSVFKDVHYVQVGNGADIQSKIDDCGSSGCLIMIPNGDYYINDTIILSEKSITLKGNSFGGGKYNVQGSVRIIADTEMTDKNMVNITNERIGLKNLILDGQNITQHGIGMYFGAGTLLIQDVQVKYQGVDGIFGANNMSAGNLIIHTVTSENGLHGIELERNDFMITDYYSFRHWNGAALMLNDGGGCQVVSMHAFKNRYCIYMNGTDASTFTNIESEQNNVSAYYFDSDHSDINRISIMGGIHYLNNYDNLSGTIFNFDANTNDIDGVTITGTTIDDSTAVFNYSETLGGKIKNIRFSDNIYESDLGDYPSNINFGVGRDISSQGQVVGMNLNTESITGTSGSETILDSSTRNNHGTNHGAIHNITNGFKGGGVFDFTDDYITIADDDSLDFGVGDFTISMWTKGTYTTNYQYLLHKRTAYQDGELELKFYGDGSLSFGTDNTANGGADIITRNTAYFLTDNRWYHITGVRNNDTLSIYVDGKKISSNSGTIQNMTSTGDILIGSGVEGSYLNGSIDEITIWNRALSEDEIEALFIQKEESPNSYVNQKDIYVKSDGSVTIDSGDKICLDGDTCADYVSDSYMSIGGITKSNEFSGAQNWSDNQNYPAACSSGYAVTENGDSNICSDDWVNIDGDTITENSTFDYQNSNLTGINELSSVLIDTTNLEADNLESNLDGTGYNLTIHTLSATDYGLVEDDIPTLSSSWDNSMDADRLTGLDYLNNGITLQGENVTGGTIAEARLPSSLYTISINGTKVDTGTIGESYLPSNIYTIELNGSTIDTGTVDEDYIEDKFLKNYGDTSTGPINMSDNNLLDLGQLKGSSTLEKISNGNLVGYWNFDTPSYISSTLTLDSSFNSNDGDVTNAILTESGKYGQGYEFDGDDDYIT
ncbi:MAG: LamG domain-containing protein, partial [Candidatus Helarchaeota archaeon]